MDNLVHYADFCEFTLTNDVTQKGEREEVPGSSVWALESGIMTV